MNGFENVFAFERLLCRHWQTKRSCWHSWWTVRDVFHASVTLPTFACEAKGFASICGFSLSKGVTVEGCLSAQQCFISPQSVEVVRDRVIRFACFKLNCLKDCVQFRYRLRMVHAACVLTCKRCRINIFYLYCSFRVIHCLVTEIEYSLVVINLFFSNLNAKRSHRASLVQCFRNCQAIGLRLSNVCFYFNSLIAGGTIYSWLLSDARTPVWFSC